MSAWQATKNVIKRLPLAEDAYRIWRDILSEPLNRGKRTRFVGRYIKWFLWDRPRGKQALVELQNGMKSIVHPDSDSGEASIYTINVDYHDNAFVRRYLTASAFIVDVGCNVGNRTLVLADKLQGALMIDANPICLDRVRENFKLNGLSMDGYHLVAKAVGETQGTISFSDFGGASTINHVVNEGDDDSKIRTVELTTIDDEIEKLGTPPCTYMKLDVEGNDYRALLGARQLLGSPALGLVKFERLPSDSLAKYLEFFQALGWTVFTLDSDGNPTDATESVKSNTNLFAAPSANAQVLLSRSA